VFREKILLVGFSGSGKSTLLSEIKKNPSHSWTHLNDLDQLILSRFGKGKDQLSDVISEQGWEKFRLWERQQLDEWLKEEGKGVLALGGGALSPMIWELYRHSRKIKFCHIWASFETCWNRLQVSAEERPMLKVGKEKFREIYVERMKIFNQIDFKIENESGVSKEELLNQFLKGIVA
jgi:shikimate kinase